jgi:drug/metabolite transporter (DMT)-like permease
MLLEHPSSDQDISFTTALFTIFLCVIFGFNAVAVKLAFSGMGVFTTAAIRFSIAAAAIYLYAKLTAQSLALKKGQVVQVLICSVLFTVQASLFYLGINKSNASRGALLSNLLPFFILFLAHFFIPGDRFTKRKFFGIFLGFGGVAFMFWNDQGVTEEYRLGDVIILGATFIWACSAIYTKKIIHGYSPFQLVFYSMIFSVPFFLIGALAWDNIMVGQLDAGVISALFYQSLITASFGFVAWNNMLKKYGAVALHSFVFVMPIAGVMLAGMLLDEPITKKILLALVCIVAGILVVHWKPKKPAPVYPIRKDL